MTILAILQQVADELGLPRPSAVTATDLQTRQLLALANREGQELMKAHDWTNLQAEYVIEIGAPTSTTGNLTEDSAVVTNIPSTTGLSTAFVVAGTGVQTATRIASVDSATQVTLTQTASASGTGVALVFTRDTFDIPDDFDRYIDQTQWDRTFQWQLLGPTSPQFDQWQRSGVVSTGPRRRWRNVGAKPTQFRVFPPPSASSDYPSTLVWEYISNLWVTKVDTTRAATMTANTDEPVFPDGLLLLGLKWRFLQSKGMDYGAFFTEWQDFLDRERARDGGQRVLSLTKRSGSALVRPSVPDGNFPSE